MSKELGVAAKSGDLERLHELLTNHTFDPGTLDAVLTQAVISGRYEVARLLLHRGAPVNHRAGLERTPLFYATRSLAMDLLLSYGADIRTRISNRETRSRCLRPKTAQW